MSDVTPPAEPTAPATAPAPMSRTASGAEIEIWTSRGRRGYLAVQVGRIGEEWPVEDGSGPRGFGSAHVGAMLLSLRRYNPDQVRRSARLVPSQANWAPVLYGRL
jgi:hypothetical protein